MKNAIVHYKKSLDLATKIFKDLKDKRLESKYIANIKKIEKKLALLQ
ncbi:MAG: hypothetical protein HRT87_08295 [Legionellales bacterium]|nr:hypothetical protein [Legionellales bacterium]